MKRNGWRLGLPAIVVLAVSAASLAAPPKVVKAIPDNGAQEVDPNLKELKIVFDQPMSTGGYSIVGGGPTFPKLIGRGRWVDAQTLVWSWQLEPQHDYWLSINSSKFTNFRNREGEAAAPYPIAFRTGQGSGPATSGGRLSETVQREATRLLQEAILKDYSYVDLRKVDWERRFREYRARLESTKTAREFAQVAAQVLAPAEDIHLWLQVEGQQVPTYRRQSEWNVAVPRLAQVVPNWKRHNAVVSTGEFEDGIRYLCLRSWPKDAETLAPAFALVADAAKAGRPLILDMRANGGGSEDAAQDLAGCFVERPVPYAKHVVRNDGSFGAPQDRVLKPNSKAPPYRGRTAVLVGLGTVSSCESFAMMMKQAPQCLLIGERTAGCSGNPQPNDLGNGVTVFVPCWKDLRLDGTCLEGEGFVPEVPVKAAAGDFEKGDPVLEEALRRLRATK